MSEFSIPFARATLLPLRPRNPDEQAALPAKLQQLNERAKADNHAVIAPTHIHVMPDGQIIGYLSIGGIPTVQAWFDSTHKNPAQSLRMIEAGEIIGREQGLAQYLIAVADNSPFHPHMPRLGYQLLGSTNLWHKPL